MHSVDVLGVRVDDVTYPEALATLLAAIDRRQPHVVTTPNPEFVMLARRDAAFARSTRRAEYSRAACSSAARRAARNIGHRPGVAGGRSRRGHAGFAGRLRRCRAPRARFAGQFPPADRRTSDGLRA
jgi:hypothetical protein